MYTKQTYLLTTEQSIYVYTYTHTTGKDRARLRYCVALLQEFTKHSLTQYAITDYKLSITRQHHAKLIR